MDGPLFVVVVAWLAGHLHCHAHAQAQALTLARVLAGLKEIPRAAWLDDE